MANNYVLFSAAIAHLTEEELRWCNENIHRYADSNEDQTGFSFVFDVRENDSTATFYSEDGGSVDQVIAFVQALFKEWRPDGIFVIEWAETCDKARPGEFGGGAAVVMATGCRTINTSRWVAMMTNRIHEERRRRGRKRT